MKCGKCGKGIANVRFESNINGKVNKEYLCEECAKDIKIPRFNDIIEEMLDFELRQNQILSDFGIDVCPKCGSLYENFINGKDEGCFNCGDTFWKRFNKTIGESKKEKQYIKEESEENNLENLQKKLEKAIEEERYEDAAKIRDKIKEKSKR